MKSQIKISIFLILVTIKLSYQQSMSCSKSTPSSLKDCSQYNSPGMYGDLCCYYEPINSTIAKKCVSIPFSAYLSYVTYSSIDNTLYKVTCDNSTRYDKKEAVLNRCGGEVNNPSMKKCKKYSSYVDSCCYYNGNEEDNEYGELYPSTDKGCYWLGAKYKGTISWGGMKLKCDCQFLKFGKWTFLIFVFTVLNIIF